MLILMLGFLILNLIIKSFEKGLPDETYIRSILLKNYDKYSRPYEQTIIDLDLILKQIVSIDEKNQVMVTTSFLLAFWKDPRLKMPNASINFISVRGNQIWLPDLYVINTADSNGFISVSDSNLAYVNLYSGEVTINYGLVGLKTRCKINIYKFPFDQQVCSIMIGSWFQSVDSLILRLQNTSLEEELDFTINPIWNFVDKTAYIASNRTRFSSVFKSDDYYFNITLKRGPQYYITNHVYPCLILNFITLITYFLPFTLQATLTITTFLNLNIISVRVAGDIPTQSDYTPLISLYFILSVFYTFLSFVWFSTASMLKEKKYLPIFLTHLLRLVIKKSNIDSVEPLKKIDQDFDIDKSISLLNLSFFFLIFTAMLISYLVIWIKISF